VNLLKPLALSLILSLSSLVFSPLTLSQTSAAEERADYTQFTHLLKSNILNEERTVVVQLPKSYKAEPDPVVPHSPDP
jgi:hypothetical protein